MANHSYGGRMEQGAQARPRRRNSSGLTRDVEILELLGDAEAFRNGGLTMSRIAELTGRDKAVISRALATLAESGLVDRDETTLSYRLGGRIYALAGRTAQATLAARARTSLRQIAQSTRETTHLCVLRGGNVLTLISELSSHEFRTTAGRASRRLPGGPPQDGCSSATGTKLRSRTGTTNTGAIALSSARSTRHWHPPALPYSKAPHMTRLSSPTSPA